MSINFIISEEMSYRKCWILRLQPSIIEESVLNRADKFTKEEGA